MNGVVSQAALVGWSDLLPRYGVDVGGLSQGLGLDLTCEARPGDHLALRDFVRFLETAAFQLRRPDFFWRAGEIYDYRLLGLVGETLLSAKTLGGALRIFAKYFGLLQDSTELTMTVDERFATLRYRILDPNIWPRGRDAEFTMGIMARMIRETVGADWRHADIIFEVDRPTGGHGLSDYLKINCGYGGSANVIRIPVAWLSLPFAQQAKIGPGPRTGINESPLSRSLVERNRRASIQDRTRYHLFKTIGIGEVDQTVVAQEMGMSRRTLRRRLGREGLNFQSIVDDCRMEVATLELVRRPRASLAEIALVLGYTEHSSFTRAFNRWNGMSPQAYRKAELTASGA